ncbi:hypothetical protein MLD52_16470 [Puniceicoccaceae bacterium K14]|nr:hypothetical protein [Puniceicoccaceae bacterium K14]
MTSKNTGTQRLTAAIAIISIALSSGLLVVIMQLIAWTSMFSEYSQVASFSDSLELTFSGNEICGICLVADEIQEDMDETLDSYHGSNTQFLIPLPNGTARVKAPMHSRAPYAESFQHALKAIPPPNSSPPPRALPA